MNLPKEIVIFLLVSSLLPFARASVLPSDCSHLGGWQQGECSNILADASLSLAQKEDLYLNLLESQELLPSHEFALNWNRQLQFNGPPTGAEVQNSGVIKDAWAKMVSVHKSFFDLNLGKWFAEPNGLILSAYGYSIELPKESEAGDCKTIYSLENKSENKRVFVNGLKAGEGEEVSYSSASANGQEMAFDSELSVWAQVKVDHYKEVQVCVWAGGIFPHYECHSVCQFSHTEYRDYSVSAKDSFKATALVAGPGIKMVLEEFPAYRKYKLLVEPSEPLNELVFSVGENTFSLSETNFDVNTSQDGIVFVERNQKFGRQTKGFDRLDFNATEQGYYAELGTTSGEACKLTLFTDFEEKQLPCNPMLAKPTKLEIETDANVFDSNQLVGVRLKLKDSEGMPLPGKELQLLYGTKQETLTTNEDGIAEAKVSAADSLGYLQASFEPKDIELKESGAVKRASVQNLKAWGTSAQVLGFFGSYYLIFLLVKKRLLLGGC